MFGRFDWIHFDPRHFFDHPAGRFATGKQHGTAWSVWTDTARKYRTRFEAGDKDAILEFARESKAVLLAPWVTTALRRWQAEGTVTAKQKIRKVITAWLDSRGKDTPTELIKLIRRDKTIVCEVLGLRIKGKTVEQAVASVAEKHDLGDDTVREIHKEYTNAWSKLKMRKSKSNKKFPSEEFLSYLQQADPARIWEIVTKRIDDEQTSLFLYLEVLSLIRTGHMRFEDLYPGWPPPGELLESWARGEARDRTAALVVYHRLVPKGSPVYAGDYLRVDLYRDLEPPRQEPDKTFLFEKAGKNFHCIQPSMPGYEDLKKAIR